MWFYVFLYLAVAFLQPVLFPLSSHVVVATCVFMFTLSFGLDFGLPVLLPSSIIITDNGMTVTPCWRFLPMLNIGVVAGVVGLMHNYIGFVSWDVWTNTLCLIPAFVISSSTFYYIHRTFHSVGWLYRHVHSLHHRNIHTCALDSFDVHPIELCVGNLLPFFCSITPLPLGANFAVAFAWVGILNILLAHVDYRFHNTSLNHSLQLSSFHNLHHKTFTKNYGLRNGFFDCLHGTLYSG